MKKISIYTLAIGIVLAFVLGGMQSCRKKKCNDPSNPECENYNPCLNNKKVEAEFDMGVIFPSTYIQGEFDFLNVDTIFRSAEFVMGEWDGTKITFRNKVENAKCTWILGSETIEAAEFTRWFKTALPGKYSVTLMVEKEPDSKCFPLDDGKDTLTRTFTLMPHSQFPIMGKYKVLFEGAKDSSVVEIRPWEVSTTTPLRNFKIVDTLSHKYTMLVNFANTQDTVTQFAFGGNVTGNNIYLYDGQLGQPTPKDGYVKLNGKEISALYHLGQKNVTAYKEIKFKGRKIQ